MLQLGPVDDIAVGETKIPAEQFFHIAKEQLEMEVVLQEPAGQAQGGARPGNVGTLVLAAEFIPDEEGNTPAGPVKQEVPPPKYALPGARPGCRAARRNVV